MPAILRVFQPETVTPTDTETPSPGWTVSEFLERWVKPHYLTPRRRSPKTVQLYRQAAQLWDHYTGWPALGAITDDHAAAFLEQLVARPGQHKGDTLSPNTARKLCTHVQKILDLAGPRNRRNRNAARLLDTVPYVERPEGRWEPVRDDYTLSEIEAFLAACRSAKPCRDLMGQRAPRWWNALVLFVYNTGLRIDTVMRLRWEMVAADEPWLTVPAELMKGGRRGGRFYLNRHAMAAAESIRTGRFPELFPWRDWPATQTWLQAQRRAILARSSLPPARRLGFHALRKALGTWAAAENPMIAEMILGHKSQSVLANHYVNPAVMVAVLDRVPQPRLPDPLSPR